VVSGASDVIGPPDVSGGWSTWHTSGVVFASIPAPVVLAWAPVSLAVGDPGRTRTVLAAISFLIAIGVGLVVLAGWLLRSTRVDPEVLAPLEVMGERSWRRADPVWQRRRLDEVRPAEAEPLDPMAPPPLADAEFDLGPRLGGFDDFDDLLRELGIHLEDTSPDEAAEPMVELAPPTGEPVTVDDEVDDEIDDEVDDEVDDGVPDDQVAGNDDEALDDAGDRH
jgi:hypothetical protein